MLRHPRRLGGFLKNIYVLDSVVAAVQRSLAIEKGWPRESPARDEELRLQQPLTAIHTRMDHASLDKLDSTITAEFWERKKC